MTDQPYTLSFVVVALNEARHIARLHQSIQTLHGIDDVQIETILVDGGSTDGTAEEARKAGFTKVIVLPDANIPVCRNAGAREATGQWLAYVDADCELAPDWLEQARPFLIDLEQVLLGWPAQPAEPMNRLQTAWQFHWLNKNRYIETWNGRPIIRREGFRLATTRNMVLHRSIWSDIDGFNEELSTGEDTDFAFRAYVKGIHVFGLPDLKMIHHGEPATLRQFYRQQLWHANRRAYQHITRLSGGRVGGNAPRYTLVFTVTFLLALAGLISALIRQQPLYALTLLPFIGVFTLPALYVSARGKSVRHLLTLTLLYFIYGWARMVDRLGLSRTKPSWKRIKPRKN